MRARSIWPTGCTNRISGSSLGTTLLAVAVLAVLAFTLSGMATTHLQADRRADLGEQALNAARSTASAAIAKIMEDQAHGTRRVSGEDVVLRLDGAEGYLTFSPEQARDQQMPYSTNNLRGTEDVAGAEGAMVPSGTVHLQSVGSAGGVTRRVEAVLHMPPFPWAVASSGKITTQNGVVVAAIPQGMWPPPTNLENLLPADMICNGDSTDAISLSQDSVIMGDVETVGEVQRAPSGVDIRGEIREHCEPMLLPDLDSKTYDPADNDLPHFTLSDPSVTELTGHARVSGDITFTSRLKLSSARLFVDGDLRLPQGVEGSGVLIANGDITIDGGATLDSPTELALLSGGWVRLRGQGRQESVLRGVFYAASGLEAEQITLVGSLITGRTATGTVLDEVNAIYQPQPDLIARSEGVPATTFYVGNAPTAGFRNADISDRRLTGIDSAGRLRDYGPLFQMTVDSNGGGFPITITLPSGPLDSVLVPTGEWVINDAEDFDAFFAELQTQVEASGSSPQQGFPPARYGLTDAFFPELQANLRATLIDPTNSAMLSAPLTLAGKISRFLPAEDRIRVVCWSES